MKMILIGAGIVGLGILILTTKEGAARDVGEAVGGAAVDAADGAVTGVVGGIGEIVGLPSPSETITDAQQCRLYMDEHGIFQASAECSAGALFEALTMDQA